MADFLQSYAPLTRFEGGWCQVQGDMGGETYAGIARNFFSHWPGWALIDVAKAHSSFKQGATAFSRHLASIPGLDDLVTAWYRAEWWEVMGLAQFPQVVANELFEQSVNLGRGGAGRYVQRLCNALNWHKTPRGEECLFDDLEEDGCLGPKSLAAIALLLNKRVSPEALVHALNSLQATHYIGLGAKNFAHRKFINGWMQRTHD